MQLTSMTDAHKAISSRAAYAVCLLMAFAGGGLTVPSGALAQQSAAALEEVIVTARKRAESLQDVPVSVTAFTEKFLKEARVETMQDLSDFTPGFDFAQAFGRQDFRPAIRGQSTILGGANAGLFVDGFFIGEGAPTVPYAALERVEVVKGPQSALYGRSTLAGAINYILKRPTEDYEGVFELGVGEDGELRGELTFSGPLSDNLGFMVSFSSYQYDGQYTNRFRGYPDGMGGQVMDVNDDPVVRGAGETTDVGGEETLSMVALLEWEPSDRMRVTGRLMIEETDDDPYAIAIQPTARNNCFSGPGLAYSGVGYYCGEIDVEEILDDVYDNKLNFETGYFDEDLGLDFEAMRLSVTLEYDLDYAMLTVNAALHDYESQSIQDQTFGPSTTGRGDAAWTLLPGFQSPNGSQVRGGSISDEKTDVEEQQFEFRFTSPEDEQLRWMVGGYWYTFEETGEIRTSGVDGVATVGEATVIARPEDDPDGDNVTFRDTPERERDNWAIFAAAEYDLSDALTAGLELRYNEEDVDFKGLLLCVDESDCNDDTTDLRADNKVVLEDFSDTFDETLYRATLDYRYSDDLLFYGVIATGNKPGSFNIYTSNPLLRAQIPVDESTAIMYEAGLKASAWEDRLQLAAAVYQTDWEDQQLTLTTAGVNGQGGTSFLDNVGETKIQGLELELQARLTDYWDLRFTYAYTDTDIKEYGVTAYNLFGILIGSAYREAEVVFGQGPGTSRSATPTEPNTCSGRTVEFCPPVDASGEGLPQVSKTQWTLSNTFNGSLENGMDWSVRVDYLHRSKRYAQIYNLAHTGDSDVIHLRAALMLDAWAEQFLGGGSLEVALWGRNLTDDQTAPALIRYAEHLGVAPKRVIGFTLPEQRNFGLDLTYRF